MAIIFFLESSKNIGGQELQIIQQMQELNKLGWRTKLLCKPNSRIHDFAIEFSLDVQLIPFRNSLHLPSIYLVIQLINDFNPLALVCHSGHDAIVGSLAAKWVGIFKLRPRVIRMRTYQTGIPSAFPYNYLFDKTYTPSEHLREKLIINKKIKGDKVSVLYPGINFEKLGNFSGTLDKELLNWFEKHPGPIICHGAMLRGEKGHQTMIRALPEVIKIFPDLRYVIAGEGELKKELEKLVNELQLQDNVYFAGMVQSLPSLLKMSTLAVLPSLTEPLGMFQIESQYLEVPTLASNVDGIPETLIHKKTGLLIEAGSSVEWAKKIIWALSNLPTMRQWAKQGKLIVEDKFSMESNTRQLIKIIKG